MQGMKTIENLDRQQRAGRRARLDLMAKGLRFAGVRTRPRRPEKAAALRQAALADLRKNPITFEHGVWLLPRARLTREEGLAVRAQFLASAIRARRREIGWTQDRLAKEAGVSRKLVIDLEKGKMTARLDGWMAVQLCLERVIGRKIELL